MFVLAQLSDLVWDGCSEFSQDELIDEARDLRDPGWFAERLGVAARD